MLMPMKSRRKVPIRDRMIWVGGMLESENGWYWDLMKSRLKWDKLMWSDAELKVGTRNCRSEASLASFITW